MALLNNDIFHGNINDTQDSMALLAADDDIQLAIDWWIQKRKLEKLADIWIKGLTPDWLALYPSAHHQSAHHQNNGAKRVSLSTYPFDKRRFGHPTSTICRCCGCSCRPPLLPMAATSEVATGNTLHPLIHRNLSGFFGQLYTSQFTGKEFFLADHQVANTPILPGVAYLKMACAALYQTLKADDDALADFLPCVHDVVWIQPFVAGSVCQLHTRLLSVAGENRLKFEIYSRHEQQADNTDNADSEIAVEKTALRSNYSTSWRRENSILRPARLALIPKPWLTTALLRYRHIACTKCSVA